MPTSVSATDFRVNFTRLLPEVMAGGTVNITKHGKTIARLMPGNVIATPNDTISATAVRVKFKSLIARLSAGETFHITKHNKVLASLTSNRIDVLTPITPKSTVNVENDDTEEEAAYNATNDAMDRLSEDMNPVIPDTSASTPGFSPSGYRLDTLTPITPEDAAMSDALADIEASEPDIDEVETSEADIVDIDVATPVTPVGDDDHLDTLTMKELHSFANKHNITIPPRSRKSEVKAVIRADMADMKIDSHDWLDEEHDDDYDALFADLADRSELRRQRRNTTV
jgi:prevent-host-death family protein